MTEWQNHWILVLIVLCWSALQKCSGEDVVLLEGYEVYTEGKGKERGRWLVEYEAASPFPPLAAQTTTMNKVPNTVKPVPTPQKTSKTSAGLYYVKPVKLLSTHEEAAHTSQFSREWGGLWTLYREEVKHFC